MSKKMASRSKKYNELSLDKKVALIKEYQGAGIKESYESLAKKYRVGKGTVSRIINDSKKHLDNFEQQNQSAKRCRRHKKTENSDLNALMKEWFDEARARSIPMSGPLAQEQALEFAKTMNLPNFKASGGWLQNFCKFYQISCKTVSGEAADADLQAAETFKSRLPEICKDYAERDIYNLDETALFYKGTVCNITQIVRRFWLK